MDPLIGTSIGRYRVERAIATGGMGRVYLAVQPEIGSRVAIKVLSEKCADDPELVERFFAEARAVNLIAHENIVKVLDLATLDDGRPFIVMEHVDGVTLAQATRGGRAPLGGIVHVFLDVLSALAAAHAIGIVHRDLKPDNIMITAKGHAKVLDFGIAKLSPQQQPFAGARTVTGALLGTPAYMAPEQIAHAGNVDARADIYAAGAVLFHAVTGRPPFGGATMFDIMRAQMEETPPSPRSFRADLPLPMERVIMRALAKDAAVRFPSAVDMSAALDEAAADLPDHAWFDLSPKTSPMRVRSSGKITRPPPIQRDTPPAISAVNVPVRRRGPLVPLAIAAGAVAIGAGAFVVLRRSPEPAPPPVIAVVAPDPAAPADAPIVVDAAVGGVSVDAAAVTQPVRRKATKPPRIDFGESPAELTYANTVERAHAIARKLPGVTTTRAIEIRVGDGGWVAYRLVVDPPTPEGCQVLVTFTKTVKLEHVRGSCDALQLFRPPRCSFTEAWQKSAMSRNAMAKAPAYLSYGNGGFTWQPSDNFADVPDDCR